MEPTRLVDKTTAKHKRWTQKLLHHQIYLGY